MILRVVSQKIMPVLDTRRTYVGRGAYRAAWFRLCRSASAGAAALVQEFVWVLLSQI